MFCITFSTEIFLSFYTSRSLVVLLFFHSLPSVSYIFTLLHLSRPSFALPAKEARLFSSLLSSVKHIDALPLFLYFFLFLTCTLNLPSLALWRFASWFPCRFCYASSSMNSPLKIRFQNSTKLKTGIYQVGIRSLFDFVSHLEVFVDASLF